MYRGGLSAGLWLAAACASRTPAPAPPAQNIVAPDGSRIIFTSTKDDDLELYTMRPDGADPRRITHRVGYDGGAFFSPDGKSIVWRAGYPEASKDSVEYLDLLRHKLVKPARMGLWTADADGGHPRQVTWLGGANFAPFFTPDGHHIIFSSNYRKPQSRNFDLYVIGADGEGLEQITFDPEFDDFRCSVPTVQSRRPPTDLGVES